MDNLKLWTICATNGIMLEKEQIEMLERYSNELKYWNEKINMISRQDIDNIYERHILHSLSILKYIDLKPRAVCLDIGTGGGLPGIPIKIAVPTLDMLLIDSIAKKIKMVEMFSKHTALKKFNSRQIRAEELAQSKSHQKVYDYIFSRAVAKISKIVAWSYPILKNSGKYILLKGGDLSEEINEAKSEFNNLHIEEIQIEIMGSDWFTNEEKKLLICSFNK